MKTVAERMLSKTVTNGECLVWIGKLDRYGYGRVWHGGKQRSAHRVAYEVHVGPIPPGLVIDHLCRNRACVNPSHMEPVTNAENIRRGETGCKTSLREPATHCKWGHEFNERNTLFSGKRRFCRACSARRTREMKMRKRNRAG